MSSQPSFNTKSPTIKRIMKEAQEISTSPSPDYHAAPLETNLFEWHFTIRGPPSSAFASGLYHGRIVLPPTYPLRPPSFRFLTPSGRFEVNREICLSISGFHEESWQPAWGLRTAIVALRSFMETEAKGQVGGVEASVAVRERLAGESKAWRCTGCGGRSNEGIMREVEERAKEMGGVKKEEEKVPEALRLGYKDELEGAKKEETTGKGKKGKERETPSGDQAEPSRAVETSNGAAVAPGSSPNSTTGITPATALTTNATPTTIPSRRTPIVPLALATQPQAQTLPAWIDKAIVGIAIALAFMLLKKFLAAS